MFIEKDPEHAAEARKAKLALEKEPQAEPARKKDLQGLAFDDQNRLLSARKPAEAASSPKAVDGAARTKALAEVRQLFRDAGLPDRLVPANLVDYRHEPGSGALTLVLQSSFTRRFGDGGAIAFERVITGVLKPGSFTGIQGIRRGAAGIDGMTRERSGVVRIHGALGPIGRSMEFRDEALPPLP